MDETITYGTLAEFVFNSDFQTTSHEIANVVSKYVCELHNQNYNTLSNSDLSRLQKSVSKFCYTFRKKYKSLGYNPNRLRLTDWFKIEFKFEFENLTEDSSSTIPASVVDSNADECSSVSRLVLFDKMRESSLSITNIQGQTDLLLSYLKNIFNLHWNESQLTDLIRDVRFFVLEIRKRFLERHIRQSIDKFVKKYANKPDSFLCQKFYLPSVTANSSLNDDSNDFDWSDNQIDIKSVPEKSKLGMGRIVPTEMQTTVVKLPKKLPRKSKRRIGLSKKEIVEPLHQLK